MTTSGVFLLLVLGAAINRESFALAPEGSTAVNAQCTLGNGRCSYYVSLSTGCSTPQERSQVQNDYSERVNEVERGLDDIRADHSRRIGSLEEKITSLLDGSNLGSGRRLSSVGNPLRPDADTQKAGAFGEDAERNENVLLSQIQKEFSNLRRDLVTGKRQLRETETLLSATRSKLNQTETEVLRTTRKLLEADLRVDELQSERSKMATKLVEVRGELSDAKAALEEAARKLKDMELELSLERDRGDGLERDLAKCHGDAEQLKASLETSLRKYRELNRRHENTTRELKRTHAELVECYRGKTTQFCGFEDPNICGFSYDSSDDGLPWTRWKGKSPSAATGPSVDHTCGNQRGYYMYVDSTEIGSAKNHNARMMSPKYYGVGVQCLEFYYHMSGRNIGTLNVYTVAVAPSEEVPPTWRAFGNQGDVWIMARLAIPAPVASNGYQVVFEGLMEKGYHGDIGIDDFQIHDGDCNRPRTKEPKRAVIT